jgi:hypothetical protein
MLHVVCSFQLTSVTTATELLKWSCLHLHSDLNKNCSTLQSCPRTAQFPFLRGFVHSKPFKICVTENLNVAASMFEPPLMHYALYIFHFYDREVTTTATYKLVRKTTR